MVARGGPGARIAPPPGLRTGRLLRLARLHGLTPLVAQALGDAAPAEVREAFLRRALVNFLFTSELVGLLRLLEGAGIPAIPFKGAALAQEVYGSFGLREFADLDFLLPRRDALRARDLLLARGYRPERELSPPELRAQLEDYGDLKLADGERGIAVELHWEVAPRYFSFALDHAALRRRLRRVSLAGTPARALSPEDLLLVLAVHGAKHCWDRLGWIVDVARLIGVHGDLDGEWLARHAAGRGALRMVRLALLLAEDPGGAVLPGGLAAVARADRVAGALAREARECLFAAEPGTVDLLRQTRFHVRSRERPRDRALYLLRLATTPTLREWAGARLPAPLFWLHRVRRPFRLGAGLVRGALAGRPGGGGRPTRKEVQP